MTPNSKYYPLFKYLEKQPDTLIVELSFAEIEELIDAELPPSAHITRAWWANTSTTQGAAWQEAGWLVDDVDFAKKWVVFRPERITYRISPVRQSKGWSGEKIKALREHAGWSQQELANKLAVRQQTISDWEVGNHAARRSMNRLFQLVAEEVGFPYRSFSTEESEE